MLLSSMDRSTIIFNNEISKQKIFIESVNIYREIQRWIGIKSVLRRNMSQSCVCRNQAIRYHNEDMRVHIPSKQISKSPDP